MSDFHRYSSWGRTRRPKNLAGADGTYAAPAANDGALTSITAATGADLRTTISSIVSISSNIINLGVASSANFVAGDEIQISQTGLSWFEGTYKIVALNSGGGNRISVALNSQVATSKASQIPATGKITRRTTSGYLTENQRFLHVTTEANVTAIYGYNFASGRWRLLKERIVDDAGSSADLDDAVIVFKNLTVPQDTHRIIDIAGMDRVAFLGTDNKTILACSTF